MKDFFTGLIERSRGTADIIRPVIPSRYAPATTSAPAPALTSELSEHEEIIPIIKNRDASATNQRGSISERLAAPQDSDGGYRFPAAEFHEGIGDAAQGTTAESKKDIDAVLSPEAEEKTGVERPNPVHGHRTIQASVNGQDHCKTRQVSVIQPQVRIAEPVREVAVKENQRVSPGSTREDTTTREANTVKVHIGRIEVRAVMPPQAPARREPAQQKPLLTLDDYLKQRGKGTR